MARKRRRSSSVRRRRDLVTPEGVPLGVVIAPASARLIALILDFAIIGLVLQMTGPVPLNASCSTRAHPTPSRPA